MATRSKEISTKVYRPSFLDTTGDLRPSVERELVSISNAIHGMGTIFETNDLRLEPNVKDDGSISKTPVIRWRSRVLNSTTHQYERAEINLGVYTANPSQIIFNYTPQMTSINFNNLTLGHVGEASFQTTRNDNSGYERSGFSKFPTNRGDFNTPSGGQGSLWFERPMATAGDSAFVIQVGANGITPPGGAINNPTYWHFYVNGKTTGPLGELQHAGSDIKLKDDVVDSPKDALERVSKLRPRDFTWKHDGRKSRGFIAQEVESVDPIYTYELNNIKNVEDRAIISDLIGSVQELKSYVEELKEEVRQLKENK